MAYKQTTKNTPPTPRKKQSKAKTQAQPTKKAQKKRTALTKITHIRKELASVYWDMKQGIIDTAEGTKLIYALSSLTHIIEQSEIELRMTELEVKVEQLKKEKASQD